MARTTHSCAILGLLVASCASATPGARPHDMSAAQHEREARANERAADVQTAEYDRDARVERERCPPGGNPAGPGAGGVCWASLTNVEHLNAAQEHRRQAAEHRAASAALRDAEARACVGISADDRDISPFTHEEDVTSVRPLAISDADARATGRLPSEQLLGAVVMFRAVPGMTAEWLQTVVDCHLARNASLGHVVPEMPDCPLVPNGVQARVTSTGHGFAVEIRSDSAATAREILSRAERLRGGPRQVAAP